MHTHTQEYYLPIKNKKISLCYNIDESRKYYAKWNKLSEKYHIIPGEGNGTPLQYSCLENPMDGGTW